MPLLGLLVCDVVGCHCSVPLLHGSIAGCNRRGVVMITHIHRLDVVPLLGAMVRCHCWVPVGGLDVVPLAGILADWTWCHGGVPLLSAITRCHVVRCHGKVPLLGAI